MTIAASTIIEYPIVSYIHNRIYCIKTINTMMTIVLNNTVAHHKIGAATITINPAIVVRNIAIEYIDISVVLTVYSVVNMGGNCSIITNYALFNGH